jgi:hypothetical protein
MLTINNHDKMKHKLLLITAILFLGIQSYAQNVAINNDGSDPDPSAALDVKASDKGVLIPRVDFNNLPLSPPTGLLVYVTDNGPDGNDAFYYYNGTQWQKLSGAAGLENFTESNYTYDSKTGVSLTPDNAAANVDFVVQPKGSGAIIAQQPDGAATGGDNRGTSAVDMQLSRGQSSQVASGSFSVIAGGYWNEASSNHATVGGGSSNIASGSYSFVPGGKTNTAQGYASTAFGVNNVAMGMNSTVSGYNNSGDGDYTFVAGAYNFANDYNETVLGRYASLGYGSTSSWVTTDRLFTIGNGPSVSERTNALTILKNANTTIGGSLTLNGNGTNTSITFPTTRGTNGQVLQTDGSGGINWASPYSGLTNFTESNYTYDTKTGVKFLATNAATDVDLVLQPKGTGAIITQQPDGTASGGNKRGDYAIDFQCVRGNASEVASGTGAIILGGGNNTSSGYGSVVLGGGLNIASGDASAALGYFSSATGHFSFSSGYESNATADYSIAMGRDAAASNEYSVAIGNNPIASGYASLAMGDYTTASGRISTALGNRTTAPSGFETVMGRFNTDYTPSSATDWIATDRLFVVGNGASDVTKSNALTILKNANTTIGGSLTINGNGTNTNITFPSSRGSNGQVLTTDGSGNTSWATPSVSQWTTSGSNIYYNSGNVGIGSSSPKAPLEFANVAANRKIVFFTTADNDHQFTGFGLNYDALRFQMGNTTGHFKFYGATSATTSNELFRIQGNGQIVIPALTTAGVLLNSATGLVSSSVGTSGQVLSTNGSGGVNWTTPTTGTVTNVSGTAPISVATGTSTPVISISAATTSAAGSMSAADKTKLDGLVSSQWTASGLNIYYTAGKVGIGTTSPLALLDIGNSVSNRKIILYSAADNDHQFSGLGINNDAFRFQLANTTANFKFYGATSATTSDELFRIEGDGNVVAQGQIKNVTDPTDAQDAATKAYVDNNAPATYQVGDFAQGGIIFWVDETGLHGLVAAKVDYANKIQWYNGNYSNTEAHGDGVYAGEMNTMLIIASQGSDSNGYGAGVCANYTVTESGVTYGDWYLPSKEELNLMYQNKTTIDATAVANGGSAFNSSAYYWSSTEYNDNSAWDQYFLNGLQSNYVKANISRVRAVRAF